MRTDYKYLVPIAGLFGAVLIISLVMTTKIVSVYGITFPASAILFPLTYLFGDVLTEVYGYSNARRVIWAGFAGELLWVLTYWLAAALPPAPFWSNQQAFETVLGMSPRIALAGTVAYLSGEFFNSYVLAKIKVWTEGRMLPLRLILSTAVGQAVDTTVVLVLAFGGVFATDELVKMGISLWIIKVVWEIVALPLSIPFIGWLKYREQEDHFDRNTDFSPFRFSK